jgi:hypothetical protein
MEPGFEAWEKALIKDDTAIKIKSETTSFFMGISYSSTPEARPRESRRAEVYFLR